MNLLAPGDGNHDHARTQAELEVAARLAATGRAIDALVVGELSPRVEVLRAVERLVSAAARWVLVAEAVE